MGKNMRKSAKRVKIDNAKLSAPDVPGYTCPSIDYVQEFLDQIAQRGDKWSVRQADLAKDVLEYIRESNDELRSSSKYWYDKYKDAA
jgi:hypothetical protein|tara:strand:+ start:216 stop:476 length:261 start_codon:yes stop_codon:yes gene_type:complete